MPGAVGRALIELGRGCDGDARDDLARSGGVDLGHLVAAEQNEVAGEAVERHAMRGLETLDQPVGFEPLEVDTAEAAMAVETTRGVIGATLCIEHDMCDLEIVAA